VVAQSPHENHVDDRLEQPIGPADGCEHDCVDEAIAVVSGNATVANGHDQVERREERREYVCDYGGPPGNITPETE